jgi:hypothetical protein
VFAWWMWALLFAAGLALVASIGCCALAMISTYWRRLKPLRRKATELDPEHMWFFKDIAHFASNPQRFIDRGAQLHEPDEVRARLRQILTWRRTSAAVRGQSTLGLSYLLALWCSLRLLPAPI